MNPWKSLIVWSFVVFGFLFFLMVEQGRAIEPGIIYPRFNELKKVTLGPDDQLDAALTSEAVAGANPFLLFTHRVSMTSTLRIQNLLTGAVQDFLPRDADSKQAKLSRLGRVVFVSYRENSKGDICYTESLTASSTFPLAKNQYHCIPSKTDAEEIVERSQPFWFNETELGFLEKKNQKMTLFRYSTTAVGLPQIVWTGNALASPNASSRGTYLIYNELKNQKSYLTVRELLTAREWVVPVNLPGTTGYASVDSAEEYIYFSHYMGDSNQDAMIDGHDNAVIWRVSLNEVLRPPKDDSKPEDMAFEQITPMDMNCNFPAEGRGVLYLTCAFEGSLDIYSLAPEGFVPKGWSENTMQEALISARSYQDRILLLNQLKSRTTSKSQRRQINERLWALHWLADEISASLFYATQFEAPKSLNIYLQARLLEKKQPLGVKTFEFTDSLHRLEVAIEKIGRGDPYYRWVKAYLEFLLGRTPNLELLRQSLKSKDQPLHYWFYFKLAERMKPQGLNEIPFWNHTFRDLIKAPSLTLESRLYYTFEFLRYLEFAPLEERKKHVSTMIESLGSQKEVLALLRAEFFSLELVLAPARKEKLKALQTIDQIMMEYKGQYFLRKAINVRTVLTFLNHQQFPEMSALAANWLRDTPIQSTEFAYAREVVISAAREQAYGYWTSQKARMASDYFFQALSLTDDLESHAGYLNTMIEIGQRNPMEERLQYLERHQTINNGIHLIRALLFLQTQTESASLEEALKELQLLSTEVVDPMRLLVKGFIELEQFRLSKKGLDWDSTLLEKARHSLILTVDLARGRRRIRAAALSNLGLLHLWSHDFAQSVRFFEMRRDLGFSDAGLTDELKSFSWYYSQALFFSNRAQRAAEVLEALPNDQQSVEFLERRGFYLMAAGQWKGAFELYERVLKLSGADFQSLMEPSRSKVQMARAYVLFKLDKRNEAKAIFEKLTKLDLNSNSTISSTFEPRELQLLSLGFLSQMGSETDQIQFLQRRIEGLSQGFDKGPPDLLGLIKAEQRLSELLSQKGLNPESKRWMIAALKHGRVYAEENGDLGQAIVRTLTNGLIHSLMFETLYQGQGFPELEAQVPETLKAMSHSLEGARFSVRLEQWRLESLWSQYQVRIRGVKPGTSDLTSWDQTPLAQSLKQMDPAAFEKERESLKALF